MKDLVVTQLDDEYLMIQVELYKKPEKVITVITETYEDGTSKVIETKTDYRRVGKRELSETVYIFTTHQLAKMQENYQLGNCPITVKGLMRYSNAYGSKSGGWYGQPAKTARALAKKGVPLPKEAFSLMACINGEV